MQCCACSKWVHLRCSQLSVSQFRALGSSHSWSCPPCQITVTPSLDSSNMYTSTVESSPASANAALSPHPHLQTTYPPSAHYISSPSALPPPSLTPGFPSVPPAFSPPPPDSLRALQWTAGGLRARSTELLHFLSSHPVDLICIQESNLNSSSCFWIPGFSALHSDRTTPGLAFSPPIPHMLAAALSVSSSRAYLFLNFLPPLFLHLIPILDYVGINISPNNSSSVSFLNVYAYLLLPNGWQNRFLFSLHSSLLQKSLHSGGLQLPSPPLGLKSHYRPHGEEIFNCVISSDLLPLNDPDTPTLLHRSSGSHFSPDISFAPSSLALSCS